MLKKPFSSSFFIEKDKVCVVGISLLPTDPKTLRSVQGIDKKTEGKKIVQTDELWGETDKLTYQMAMQRRLNG